MTTVRRRPLIGLANERAAALRVTREMLPMSDGEVDYSWKKDGDGFELSSSLGWIRLPPGETPDCIHGTFPAPQIDAVFGMRPSRPFKWNGDRFCWRVVPRWALGNPEFYRR